MMTMETSSPLAALQPPSMSGRWAPNALPMDFSDTFLRPPPPMPRRPADFNFADMGMRKSTSDYFSWRPARGSSPTQSLAVDLSQNFHIDQSPQLPTPRRALFTAALSTSRKDCVVTPPVPSSSPGPYGDHMDLSPLPHKAATRPLPPLQTHKSSPSPETTPSADGLQIPRQLRRSESQPTDLQAHRQMDDRPPLALLRPGVRKAQSTAQLPLRRPRTSETLKPAFIFGVHPPLPKALLESFAESPPSDRKLPPSLSNPSLVAESLQPCFDGSPIANPVPRRPLVGRVRSGTNRRTMSMQYNDSTRAMRAEKKRCCTTGSMSGMLRDQYTLKLPHTKPVDEADALPRISRETLVDVLAGRYASEIGEFLVIDCRFEYEYDGGHIDCALNFNDKDKMAGRLFEETAPSRKALIFHCEYSVHRAPLMARFVRQHDRMVNQDTYPRLTYPEVYILDGGYHGFFKEYPNHCFPQSYVEMDAKEHESACELGLAKVKGRGRLKLSRAQTYAFGQHASTMSPVPCAFPSTTLTVDAMDVDFNSPVELRGEAPTEFPSHSYRQPHLLGSNRMTGHVPLQPRRFDSY